MRQISSRRRVLALASLGAAAALTLSACSAPADSSGGDDAAAPKAVSIGISQLVQHPALDAATEGFKQAFIDAGYVEGDTVKFDVQNANGEQATAVTIAQTFATSDVDLVLAVATPAAQAAAQAITDKPVLFTAVTDAVSAELVKSDEEPGANVTGTVDAVPADALKTQFELITEMKPDAKKVGIVYASGEVNSEVQVKDAQAVADEMGLEIVTKTVTTANDIAQATEALGDVDAIYVPTDNMVVSGIASLVQVAEANKIPVIGAEPGTVEGGAVATYGIDYTKLGKQTGEMALKVLDGADPATTPVETPAELSYVVNPAAAERMGVEIPKKILDEATVVE
ncbi:ABC transporter substrate-binding protein [Leucobacter luti]|uniref:Putative ABC transport system substrate-binding protein n=1 Tax=Leucobacter luti TaxID=340320 RepID=A0A4R6S389_9MICO|nr:ABC transporter substrate-binding protein [Leucobacter luti]MCW2289448.1 putative ABC transport system substrate-binding protein [Leucobacter luti]QYM74785.1 ABC transporter substrate-binding protein [Leucobacter luti]TCK40007.1 putative ABC transport system substrate-binding protein [Leucobacter luti]TDP93135.1 putative ABC transport system substrate-binding protein [Leucobacter luti]